MKNSIDSPIFRDFKLNPYQKVELFIDGFCQGVFFPEKEGTFFCDYYVPDDDDIPFLIYSIMSVLTAYFDPYCDQCSPLCDDFERVVHLDEKGNEYVSYEKIDYRKFQESLGPVDNWSLDSLVKAGIDPSFPIRTGYNTRLEGIGEVERAAAFVEQLLNEESVVEPKN